MAAVTHLALTCISPASAASHDLAALGVKHAAHNWQRTTSASVSRVSFPVDVKTGNGLCRRLNNKSACAMPAQRNDSANFGPTRAVMHYLMHD